jgi:predicted alternative tryptophan synthase beta-subunit
MDETKILLPEKDIPLRWYNIQADLPKPLRTGVVGEKSFEGRCRATQPKV